MKRRLQPFAGNLIFRIALISLATALTFGQNLKADGTIKLLLVGDSTTIGNMPREVDPDGPHLEQMIEQLAEAEGLPKLEVVNAGKGGETAKRLLGSKWYDEAIANVADVDYICVRLGINDWFRCEDLETEFPAQMKSLIDQLRIDHPDAVIFLSTICRFMKHEECVTVNELIKQVARDEGLQLFDLYTPYHEYLVNSGENTLNVRQCYLDKIPEKYHQWLKPYTSFRKGWGNKPSGLVVKVNDMSLDPIFGQFKGWFGDRHPNSAGYNLIAAETVKYLTPVLGQTKQPATATSSNGRPNVVWIVSDDLSPELGCYGYPGIETPNIDRLASSGARFSNAFATAPVCSSSRTAFQTGQYQTTVGGHHHDTRVMPVLPPTIPTVTGMMQRAGYFVSNGRGNVVAGEKLAKSHLNFAYDKKTFFDGHDWTQRTDGQPFFAQVQIKEPHRDFVQRTKGYPDSPIPPYYPEHPVTRADWDNYLASVEVLDQKVGAILDRLDAEGLADNTIVIFFGDHGRPHVRDKQWLYDGGLRVPLIVRWPGKTKPGTVDERLVSLLDLMPTTLAAANEQVPANVNLMGHDLLDASWQGHEYLFAARDRCGEAVDRIRSCRTKKLKYIRNFHPDKPYLQHSSYKKLMYPVETVMKVRHAEGKWDSLMMATTRPKEELYDLSIDPHEMTNVAGEPDYADELLKLRSKVDTWIEETNDLGRIDESLTVDMKDLRAEKWKWFEKTMKSRGLKPKASDEDYLKWWKNELGLN